VILSQITITRSDDETLFSTWFDDYNRIHSRQNFNTFDELLTKADEDMTTMRTEQIKHKQQYNSIG
jgi:succinate dehydrogenase flavin-adding protein (antitoxin of CptAB toxin-antitoxin module)